MNKDELTQRVINHLTGRSFVDVKWERPPAAHATGQVVNEGGRIVVYVDPFLTGLETRFKTFLHECGHIRNGIGPSDEDEALFCGHPSIGTGAHPMVGVTQACYAYTGISGQVHGPFRAMNGI